MAIKIFFSWQLDTPAKEGRNLILRGLEIALESISVDMNIEEALRDLQIDRDTLDVAGTPPIVDTIFQKINDATIFVPDLTFVSKRIDGRPAPNPNVLIEYGWALKTLGHGRMLPVMNTAFGKPDGEAMPFDMRHLRFPIQYDCAAGLDDNARAAARNKLSVAIKTAITSILMAIEPLTPLPEQVAEQPFQPHQAKDGKGRFRAKAEALGFSDDGLVSTAKEIFLVGGAAHWMRVMPTVESAKTWSLGTLRKNAFSQSIILPISSSRGGGGFNYLRAEDGVGLYAPLHEDRTTTKWVVFVFTDGEIWSVDSYIIEATGENEPGHIYLDRADLARSLQDYSNCLLKLGIAPPFGWELGLEGVKGRGIFLPNDPFARPRGACVANEIVASGTYYPDDDPQQALQPFFDKVFDLCGLAAS